VTNSKHPPRATVTRSAPLLIGIAEKILAFLGLLADLGYIGLHPQMITGYAHTR
jgi:hypothetical protein